MRDVRTAIGHVRNGTCATGVGFERRGTFWLAFAEFDDQGEAIEPKQTGAIREMASKLALEDKDVVFVVFVHGWRHNAWPDDQNLIAFEQLLGETAAVERQQEKPREIYAIYISWRGLSFYGNDLIEYATFWGRQKAARRVSNGSVRELFGYLRHYRDQRRIDPKNAPMVVIAGHSFGGLVVYSALEQSLIESASAPSEHIIPGFADLVLLINPAFEGSRFLPIYRLRKALERRDITQVPIFVCAYAENDGATKFAFPAGNLVSSLTESSLGRLQALAKNHTIGNVPDFKTHDLSLSNGTESFVLRPDPEAMQPNPFWVVRAQKEIIDGHNGIWQRPFLTFLKSLLWAKAETTRAGSTGPQRATAGYRGRLSDLSSDPAP